MSDQHHTRSRHHHARMLVHKMPGVYFDTDLRRYIICAHATRGELARFAELLSMDLEDLLSMREHAGRSRVS
jgi:hypothetical protein